MRAPDADLEGEIDHLYQLPLAEFTEARNGLAARLKGAGDKTGAAQVKGLARASVPAWAVNQVYWTARREFEGFLASAQRLQSVQAEGAGGEALREAMKARRESLAAAMRRAESFLNDAGHAATADALRRVSETLQALAAESARPGGARPGRLVHELEPPGFEMFAALAATSSLSPSGREPSAEAPPAGPSADNPPKPAERPEPGAARDAGDDSRRGEALERAREALAEAERRLELARREAREAEGARLVAEKRAAAAKVELDQVSRRFDQAKERAAALAADAEAARVQAERLAGLRDAAETARDAAARAVRGVD